MARSTAGRPGLSRRRVLGYGLASAGALALEAKGAVMSGTSMQSGYANADGWKVYYEVHGGPLGGREPYVLLHGGMMAIETAFAGRLLPMLARGRPVIAIEQQGHGHTALRPGKVELGRMVDDTAAVLAHLKVARGHFVGHSLGGMIALGMAIDHPDRVASLTPISATYNLEGMLPELVAMQRDPTHVPSAQIIPLLPSQKDFEAWKEHFGRTAPDPAAFDDTLARLNVMLTQWQGWTPAQLGAIRAPTLLAIGDNDFVRIEHAAEMKRLIPGAQLAVLPGTTHMNIIDRGGWLVPLIEARMAGG